MIKVYVIGRKGDKYLINKYIGYIDKYIGNKYKEINKYFWYSYVKWLNIKIFINILNNFHGFFKIVIVNINV